MHSTLFLSQKSLTSSNSSRFFPRAGAMLVPSYVATTQPRRGHPGSAPKPRASWRLGVHSVRPHALHGEQCFEAGGRDASLHMPPSSRYPQSRQLASRLGENFMNDPDSSRSRAVVPFADLAEFCGRSRPTSVRKWCESKGILYFLDADGKPCTTEAALNEALHRGRKARPNFLCTL